MKLGKDEGWDGLWGRRMMKIERRRILMETEDGGEADNEGEDK